MTQPSPRLSPIHIAIFTPTAPKTRGLPRIEKLHPRRPVCTVRPGGGRAPLPTSAPPCRSLPPPPAAARPSRRAEPFATLAPRLLATAPPAGQPAACLASCEYAAPAPHRVLVSACRGRRRRRPLSRARRPARRARSTPAPRLLATAPPAGQPAACLASCEYAAPAPHLVLVSACRGRRRRPPPRVAAPPRAPRARTHALARASRNPASLALRRAHCCCPACPPARLPAMPPCPRRLGE